MNNQIVTSNEVNIKVGINLGNDKPVFKVSGRCLAASISYSAFILCTLTVIFFIVMENTNSQLSLLGQFIKVTKDYDAHKEQKFDDQSKLLITRYNFVTYSQGVVYVASISLLLACLFKTAESCCMKHIPEEFFTKTKMFHMSLYLVTVALILASGSMRQFALIFTKYDFSLLGKQWSIPMLTTTAVETSTIDNCFLMVLAYIGMMLFASVIAFTYTAFYTEEKQIQAIGQTTTAMFASVAGGQEKCVTRESAQEFGTPATRRATTGTRPAILGRHFLIPPVSQTTIDEAVPIGTTLWACPICLETTVGNFGTPFSCP